MKISSKSHHVQSLLIIVLLLIADIVLSQVPNSDSKVEVRITNLCLILEEDFIVSKILYGEIDIQWGIWEKIIQF